MHDWKAFPVYILLITLTLLSTALYTGCFDKKALDNQEAPRTEIAETQPQSSSEQSEAAVKVSEQAKLPKLIDLGADKCIPCKMMAPILEELESEYAGKLEIVFIDVWKNPDKGKEYGVKVIPTQIFYDTDGNEFYRHVGFFSKEDILETFREKGMNFNAG